MSFQITKKTQFLAFLMSCVLIISQVETIVSINWSILGKVGEYKVLKYYGILIVIVLLSTLIHELIHGLVYKSFGGNFVIGVKGMCAYTKETTGIELTVSQFAVVLLAPVTLISTISLFIPVVGSLVFFVNLLGSTGDFVVMLWLMKIKKDSFVVDRDDCFYVKAS